MKIIEGREADYKKFTDPAHGDEYSRAIVDYTEVWAALMEKALTEGKSLSDCWEQLSHEADTDGVTGFMYGISVQTLARFWIHGDELRKLHNAKYGVTEDRAKGGTVNPAILEFNDSGEAATP